MLAHKAEEEGIACVEHIVTGYGHVNYDAIPERRLHRARDRLGRQDRRATEGQRHRVSQRELPLSGQRPRARPGSHGGPGEDSGRREDGSHPGRPHPRHRAPATLIAEAAVAIEFGASSEDIARTSHAHPTLSEIVREAALAVDGRAIHI